MPIYDYVCTSCGRRDEVVHAVHASGPEACDVCGGQMRKALSPPAIVFKGSGWAKKDARASATARAKDGSNTTTTDSKPAAETGAGTSKEASAPAD